MVFLYPIYESSYKGSLQSTLSPDFRQTLLQTQLRRS